MKSPFKQNLHKVIMPGILGCILITACGNAKTKVEQPTTDKVSKLDATAMQTLKDNLKKNLKATGVETEITDIQTTEMPGLYWATAKDLPSFFTDKTGQFVVQGDVLKIGGPTPVDITAKIRQKDAKELLAKVDKKDMVIFKPKGEVKGVVYAFTDVDCGYCRKLHNEMKQINDQGIEVRYLAWPRSPQSIPAMVNIWCAEDRNVAMNTAKSGGTLKNATCENPVEKQVQLGHQLGVRGTPAIYTEYGAQIGGYLPPNKLAELAVK